jgi:hypothetical protein
MIESGLTTCAFTPPHTAASIAVINSFFITIISSLSSNIASFSVYDYLKTATKVRHFRETTKGFVQNMTLSFVTFVTFRHLDERNVLSAFSILGPKLRQR